MAKSVLELAVGTGQWDAGLKKAKSALDNFTQSQGGLQQALAKDSENIRKFVQMMGQMDSTAKTAKGQMNDYKSTIEQLTMQYNRMSEAQKKTIGQDYLNSIDQIKEKFRQAKAEMDGINKSLGDMKMPDMKGGGFLSGIGDNMSGALQVFGGNLMTKGAGMLAGLASEMGDMVKQGVELAKQGEGIRIAFERLGRGDILDGLRQATHGTVTDIELMKAAVKFNDFKLPLDELGTMLAFAQQKAKDTGQSVDYMVDSIVTGLGRKSLMILDNLGLSATEIRERMKETGDMTKAVGAIIRDQMAAAGDYVETAADRAAQANVSLQNKMEELGRKFAPVEEASNQLWTSIKIGILDIIGGPLATMLNQLTEAGRLRNQLNKMNGDPSTGQPTKVQQQLSNLRGSNYKNANYRSQLAKYDRQISTYQTMIDNGGKLPGAPAGSGKDVRWLQSQMDALKVMRSEYMQGAKDIMKPVETNIKTDKSEQNVKTLTAQLKELEKQRKEAVKKGDQEQVEALTKQISQTKTNLGYLNPNATKSPKTTKTDIQYADDSIMAQEKLVSDLTQKWKTASGELRDGYLKDLEEAQQKLAEMTGKAKGPDLDKLFPDMSKENYNTGYAGSAQAKYDSARVDLAVGPMNFDAINDYIGSIKGMLKDADLGSELYTSMTDKLKDATTVSTLLQEMMERGLAGADLETTAQALKEKLLSPEGIDQTAVQSFLDTLNAQIEEAGGVGLKINPETGEVTDDKDKRKDNRDDNRFLKKNDDGKYEAKMTDIMSGMAGGINNVVSGLSTLGVEIPAGLQSVLGGMQAISSILSGIAVTVTAIEAISGADAIIPFAHGGIVPAFAQGGTIPKFAGGGLIGRAAGGMMIPGNSMSGDNLRLPVDGGRGMIGVNSGELILNRAQQGNLASQLEGGGMENINIDWVMRGEDMRAVINNNGRRTGRGEIVQSRRNRS